MKQTTIKPIRSTAEKINFIVDEKLDHLKGRNLAPKKLEEANLIIKNLKIPISK